MEGVLRIMTKTYNTKIQLRYDSYKNWNTVNPTLLQGEVAIVNVPASTNAVANEPAVLMKVGPGAFNDLPWFSALAADVLAACKSEGTLKTFVNNVIDEAGIATDEALKALTGRVDGLEAKVGKDTVANQIKAAIDKLNLANSYETKGAAAQALVDAKAYADEKDAPISAKADANEAAIAKLNGTAETKGSVAKAVADAKKEMQTVVDGVDGKVTALDGRVTTAEGKIDTLEKAVGAGGSVETQITNKIETLDKADTAVEKQFVSAVSEVDGIISVKRRALVAEDVPELAQAKITGLEAALAGKQETLVFETAYNAENNKAATMTDVKNAVKVLSGAMHFVGKKESLPGEGQLGEYKAGDVILVGTKEYVFDGAAFVELGDEGIYAIKGQIVDADIAADAAIAQSKIAGLVDALAAKAEKTAVDAIDTRLQTAEGKIQTNVTDIAGLKTRATDIESAASTLKGRVDTIEGDYLKAADKTALTKAISLKADQTALDTANGRITANEQAIAKNTTEIAKKANTADLAAVATSGKFVDLVLEEGDEVVFACGGAS